ncbi:MAG: OsmC family protein [Gemmatimonadetes bacterium]|nr:OsmC family protein [Gemmatimonadota bacterium]
MQKLPHLYSIQAVGPGVGDVRVSSASVPDLVVEAPVEFDGPGDRWSPETLLAAAVGSCFITTFRAIARSSHFEWASLTCAVDATLEKADGGLRFTNFDLDVDLTVEEEGMEESAHLLLEKTEKLCLITKSLRGATQMKARVQVGAPR